MRSWLRLNGKSIALVCLLIIAGIFLIQTGQARADWCWSAGDCIDKALATILATVLWVLAQILIGLMKLFNIAIHFRLDTEIYVISYSWGIIRDFCNMLFIVALIVMAFATIFEFSQYNFRNLIAKFLIAALLINFSLVIGGIIIKASDMVSQTFLASIGNTADRIGQALSPASILNPSEHSEATAGLLTLQTSMSIFMFAIVDISLFIATVVSFARIPILAILLIFSPLAWILGILPNTRTANENWWKQFIGWNMFLPIFLLFLYFGMFFFSHQADFLNKISAQVPGTTFIEGLGLSLQMLFYYFMTGFIFVGGTGMALSGAFGIGGGAVGVARWARQGALNFTGITSAGKAFQMKREQIAKEGLPGRAGRFLYGGQEGVERLTQQYAQRLGVREAPKEFVKSVDTVLSRMKNDETAGKLKIDDNFIQDTYERTARNGGIPFAADTPEGAARRTILYERGMISGEQFTKDMAIWVRRNPFLAQAMSERARKANYKQVPASRLLQMAAAEGEYSGFNTPNATAARREWFSFLKEEKGNDEALKELNAEQFKTAMDLFGGAGSSEAEDFKKAIANKRPDVVAEYENEYGKEYKVGDEEYGKKGKGAGVALNIRGIIGKKKVSDIANMLTETWDTEEFQAALEDYLVDLERQSPPKKTPDGKIKKPGGGQQFKGNLENAVRGNIKKMKVLEGITSVESVFMPPGAESEESPKSPPPAPPPPAATGVSYREVRGGNIVNLRGIAKTNSFGKDKS